MSSDLTPAQAAVARLHAVFGEPKTTDVDTFLAEYERALTGIEARVLTTAVDRLMKHAKFWPRPSEILEETSRVAAVLYQHRPVIDWDAVEIERRSGWTLSDITRRASPQWQADHARLMENFREFMGKVEGEESPPDVDWKGGQRDEFERMQRESPNQGLHRTKAGMS